MRIKLNLKKCFNKKFWSKQKLIKWNAIRVQKLNWKHIYCPYCTSFTVLYISRRWGGCFNVWLQKTEALKMHKDGSIWNNGNEDDYKYCRRHRNIDFAILETSYFKCVCVCVAAVALYSQRLFQMRCFRKMCSSHVSHRFLSRFSISFFFFFKLCLKSFPLKYLRTT